MLFASTIIFFIANALPSLRTSLFLMRIIVIALFYTAALYWSVVYIQSIGFGIGVLSELFYNFSSSEYFINTTADVDLICPLLFSLVPTKLDEKKIPWNDTDMMKGNRIVLRKMYESYSSNPIVKSFLDAKVNHLLNAPEGDTGISYSSLTKDSILTNFATKSLTKNYKPSLFTSNSGVYVIQSHNTTDLYVGSATDFSRRFSNHYSSLREINQLNGNSSLIYTTLSSMGPTNFSWSPVALTPNYHKEFVLLNQNSTELIKDIRLYNVLLHFTQYEARATEQAILSATGPSLNTESEVSLTLEWDSDKEYTDKRGSKPIQAIEKISGKVYYFNSIRQAADLLNVEKRNIQTYINCINFHKSSVLGEYVRFVDITKPMKEVHPYSKENLPLVQGINYDEIPLGQIWAYDESLNKIGEFTSSLKAASLFNISKGAVLNNMNKKFTDGIFEGKVISLLFCRNILGAISNKIPVVVIDLLTDQAYYYSTIGGASQAIGMGKTINPGTVNSKWIKPGRLYQNRWLIVERSNYTGKPYIEGPTTLV